MRDKSMRGHAPTRAQRMPAREALERLCALRNVVCGAVFVSSLWGCSFLICIFICCSFLGCSVEKLQRVETKAQAKPEAETTSGERSGPTQVLNKGVRAIAAGIDHSCALLKGGEIRCSTSLSDLVPKANKYLNFPNAKDVLAAQKYACAHSPENVSCWGQIAGVYGPTALNKPTKLPEFSDVASLAAGQTHICGLKSDGREVVCYGSNNWRALGVVFHNRKTERWQLKEPARLLAAAKYRSCALAHNGDVTCWGDDSDKRRTEKLALRSLTAYAQGSFFCGVNKDDTLICFSYRGRLQKGQTHFKTWTIAKKVSGDLFMGPHRLCRVSAGGREKACCHRATLDRPDDTRAPYEASCAPLAAPQNIADIAFGAAHEVFLTAEGGLFCEEVLESHACPMPKSLIPKQGHPL